MHALVDEVRVLFVTVFLTAASMVGSGVASVAAQEAIFLVRHAERLDNSQDSPLSAEGRARAARLAEMLRDARITAIYVSEFQRTTETAKPLADKLGLQVQEVPAADQEGLIAKLRRSGPHDRALVVSHADRLPALLKALGYEQDLGGAIGEYDNLFVVLPYDKAGPVGLWLHY